MSSQTTSREEAQVLLQLLQYDYADGVGDYGPVITEFSALLERYRQQFYEWQPLRNEHREEQLALGSRFFPMLKTAAITAAAFLLVSLLFKGTLLRAVFYITAGIALSTSAKDTSWAFKLIGVNLSLLFVSVFLETPAYDGYVFWVLLAAYVLSAFHLKAKEARRAAELSSQWRETRQRHDQAEELMEANRQRLALLTPRLREEFQSVRAQMLEDLGDALCEEDRELCSELPLLNWWDVPIAELQEVERRFTREQVQGHVAWETRWVQRSPGSEFQDAGEEYSPLSLQPETKEASRQFYDHLKRGAVVLDFISRGTSSSMESETIYYKDYKHSSLKRFGGEMAWLSLGNQIDQARQKGDITDKEYRELKDEYFWGSILVNDAINEKVEKEDVEYHQVKSHTNIWTGQLLLTGDDGPDGGLAIMDYRCQPGHLFENLDTLHNVKITRVLGDVCARNPVVMAKLHRVCRECR